MNDSELKHVFEMSHLPSPAARERLARRLDQAAVRERQETGWLRGVSAVLALTVGALGIAPTGQRRELANAAFFTQRVGRAIQSAPIRVNGEAVNLPVASPGVRLYWIFRG